MRRVQKRYLYTSHTLKNVPRSFCQYRKFKAGKNETEIVEKREFRKIIQEVEINRNKWCGNQCPRVNRVIPCQYQEKHKSQRIHQICICCRDYFLGYRNILKHMKGYRKKELIKAQIEEEFGSIRQVKRDQDFI